MRANNFIIASIFASTLFLLDTKPTCAYSILTHEAIIDACWIKSIQPLLKLKYPQSTAQQLKEAHAYAYGGSIAPDMGYFPFGSPFFTDLVHYVRTGDFVNALLDEAQNINEYAFALGFLSHYMADKYGHSIATNISVPIDYPKDKRKYGNVVTYGEDHISHMRMEFAFDVLQIVKGNYASQAYHDFIGFQVSRGLLERAFCKVYGLDINDIFGDFSLSIATFRWSVKSLFPALTRAAWLIKKNEILKLNPKATSRNFTYHMHRVNYYSEFGKKRKKPGVFAAILSFIIRVIPKVGPLRVLKFKAPGPVAEKLFIQSFDTVLVHYTMALKNCRSGKINFPNIDFDTGNLTAPGEYPLADKNYDLLLGKLQKQDFILINSALKQNILHFYAHRSAPVGNRKVMRAWKKTTASLQQLKQSEQSRVN